MASSRIRFRELDVHDTGFYRCEASNGVDTVSGESILKVTMPQQGRNLGGFHHAEDDDYFYDEDYDEHDESKLVPQGGNSIDILEASHNLYLIMFGVLRHAC